MELVTAMVMLWVFGLACGMGLGFCCASCGIRRGRVQDIGCRSSIPAPTG
jgi:hypothetical protein